MSVVEGGSGLDDLLIQRKKQSRNMEDNRTGDEYAESVVVKMSER